MLYDGSKGLILLLFVYYQLQLAFSIVLIKHRNVIIKEGVALDPTAAANGTATSATAAEKSIAVSTGASSPKVIRTDLEVGKSLAPPVSV